MLKVIVVLLGLLSFDAFALTAEQNTALRAAVLAEPTIASCVSGGNDVCVADWLNSASAFIVWRTKVSQEEYQSQTSPAATQFDWAGTGGFIARSQGERDAWRVMFSSGSVDPSKTNVRTAFSDIFSGTSAGAVNNRTHLLSISKRVATNAEKTLATGTGTEILPGLLSFEGLIGVNDIAAIMGR